MKGDPLYTAKPGVVIGKGGAEIEVTRKELSKLTDKKVLIDIKEIKRPDRGRAAGCGEHRAAAGKPRFLQKGDEVLHGQNHEGRRAGHQDRCGRPSGRCGYRAYRVLQRGNHPAADAEEPTSTTASQKRTPPTARWASRFGSTKARSSSCEGTQ